jgi:predicted nucleic acid-binding protein
MKKWVEGWNKMQTNIQNVYIDTCFFQGYLWGKTDEKKNAKDIFYRIKSYVGPDFNVKIPFIVIGELINNLIRKNFKQEDREEIMYEFFELQKDLKADIIPPNKCCYDIAKSLTAQDSYFAENAPTDAFIVSYALCDPDSSHLLTTDSRLLESESLKKIEKGMRTDNKRNRQLKITEEFGV